MGLDLASTSSGVCILQGEKVVHTELVQPPAKTKDPLERISFIFNRINQLYSEYNIDYMAIEDVPLNAGMRNFAVAKHNILLLGGIIALGNLHNSAVILMLPSEWRKAAGVYDEAVAKEEMAREFQKKKGIEIANKLFNFGFTWVSDYRDKIDHNSDIAESALIALAAYRIFTKGGNNLDGTKGDI